MTSIFFDIDALYIEGYRDSFVAGSLVADVIGEDIGVRVLHGAAYLNRDLWTTYTRRGGEPFSTKAEVKAYLDGEFAKTRQNNTLVLPMVAAVPLGGHRVVRGDPSGLATYASADDLMAPGAVAGITARSAEAGSTIDVVAAGEMVEPSWSWASGPVWLGLDGALTQAAPASGIDQQVGVAIAPTRLIVDIAPAILLAQ